MDDDVQAFRTYVETSARKRALDQRCRDERRAIKERLDAVANALRGARSMPVTKIAGQNSASSCTLYAYRMPNESYVSCRRASARARFHTLAEIERCLQDIDAIAAALRAEEEPLPTRIVDAMIEASRDRSSTATRFVRTTKRPRGKQLCLYDSTPNENALLTSFCALDDELVELRRKRKRVIERIERALDAAESAAVRYVEANPPAIDNEPAARTARIADPTDPSKKIRFKVAVAPDSPPLPEPTTLSPKAPVSWMSRPVIEEKSVSKESAPDVTRALRVRIGDMRTVVIEALERMIPATVRVRDNRAAVLWLRQNRDRLIESITTGIRALGASERAVARPDVRPRKKLRIRKMRT